MYKKEFIYPPFCFSSLRLHVFLFAFQPLSSYLTSFIFHVFSSSFPSTSIFPSIFHYPSFLSLLVPRSFLLFFTLLFRTSSFLYFIFFHTLFLLNSILIFRLYFLSFFLFLSPSSFYLTMVRCRGIIAFDHTQ